MFASLLNRLIQSQPDQLPDEDARLALTALLVRVARSDGDYAPAERANIEAIITARYALTPDACEDLRVQAEQLETEAPDTVRFTRAIKNAVSYDQRLAVIEALWKVALADGVRSDEENALLRMVANLLGVSDVDSAAARLRISG